MQLLLLVCAVTLHIVAHTVVESGSDSTTAAIVRAVPAPAVPCVA
jgi:hypothetical protein